MRSSFNWTMNIHARQNDAGVVYCCGTGKQRVAILAALKMDIDTVPVAYHCVRSSDIMHAG